MEGGGSGDGRSMKVKTRAGVSLALHWRYRNDIPCLDLESVCCNGCWESESRDGGLVGEDCVGVSMAGSRVPWRLGLRYFALQAAALSFEPA